MDKFVKLVQDLPIFKTMALIGTLCVLVGSILGHSHASSAGVGLIILAGFGWFFHELFN